jgi:hypothetical protein
MNDDMSRDLFFFKLSGDSPLGMTHFLSALPYKLGSPQCSNCVLYIVSVIQGPHFISAEFL